jgi:site-specific DNA recombinase
MPLTWHFTVSEGRTQGAVRAILINPRYTGRQVWNKQRKDEVLLDVNDVALGHTTKMRWNQAGSWIYSDQIVHPPVISTDVFGQAQDVLAGRGREACQHKPHATPRSYAFGGAVFCGVCQRRMQGQWINHAPYYRCRFLAEYALANKVAHPRNVYLREDAFAARVTHWLTGLFAPGRLQHTIDQMTAAQDATGDDATAETARARIADAGRKMARYKAAIDAGGDLEEISTWIGDAKAQRLAAEAELRRATTRSRMTRQQIADLISEVSDLAATLRGADSETAAEAYRQLGLRLTYYPDKQIVRAAAAPQPDNIGKWLVSEGRITPYVHACAHRRAGLRGPGSISGQSPGLSLMANLPRRSRPGC